MKRAEDTDCFQRFSDALLKVPVDEIGASHFLNGAAASALREFIPLRDRRNLGAFFTSHELAENLVAPLANINGKAVILDPCCGAGDLLLASLRVIAPVHTTKSAHVEIRGTDIVRAFTEVALARLSFQLEKLNLDNINVNILQHDGTDPISITDVTHLIFNPPFGLSEAPSSCSWAGGRVNKAALFVANILPHVRIGTSLHIILPDVLRSGTRYARWRRLIDQQVDIESITTVGKFDKWTDVDVFIMTGQVMAKKIHADLSPWIYQPQGRTVGNFFKISVGSVVNNRDPQRGPWYPFLTAKSFPTWNEVESVIRKRRFSGRVKSGPFVAIPRTSSPSEPIRGRGAIINDNRPVAVDNHILVASPRDGRLESCRELLKVLKRPAATTWLNNVNRCRHLTVSDIESIPWNKNGKSDL